MFQTTIGRPGAGSFYRSREDVKIYFKSHLKSVRRRVSETDRLEVGRASAGVLSVIGYIGRSPASSFSQNFCRAPRRHRADAGRSPHGARLAAGRISACVRPVRWRVFILAMGASNYQHTHPEALYTHNPQN